MLALALSVALLSQEPPRLRTICPNGAAIIVERMPDEPMISVQLWASARNVPETAKTHGWRHLLEHLIARGSGGDLDRRLEANGSYLRARTFRDAIQIEVNVGPRQLDLAISAILDVLKPLQTDQAAIDRERAVMKQEFATYDDASRLGAAAWQAAYGESGLDSFGTLEVISKSTPEALRELQRKHFYPENLVLSIAGPVDIKQATALATQTIGMKQGATRAADTDRPAGKGGRVETEGFGEGRAALVGAYDRPQTAGALAFALAVASGVEGAFVTYTPSLQRGLIIVGQTEKLAGVGLKIDGTGDVEMRQLYALGRILARNWIQRYLQSATGVAYIRGFLLCQSHASRPEAMLAAVDQLTFAQFQEAARAFSKEQAVTVVGN